MVKLSDFKERVKLIMDTSIIITMVLGVAMSFLVISISIKIKEIPMSAYSYIYLPLIIFYLYYNRYSHMMNFSVTRDEYFKIGQGLNLILSLLIWLMYLLAASITNESIQTSTVIFVFLEIVFFTSLSNMISLLMINSSLFIFLAFGGTFAIEYVSKYIYFAISPIYMNIIFILLTVSFGIFGKYIIRNIDFKLREVK